ncbi:MAG TPA: carbohydrate porin [Stellaceae bacterium]|jgi:porin|nr:carbohydrate porin [Stellaceae bacterium]
MAFSGTARAAMSAMSMLTLLAAMPALADGTDASGASSPSNAAAPLLILGDIGGLRPKLAAYGLTPALVETDEILGNVSGGVRRGMIFEGLTDISLALDLRPQLHWRGNFFVRAYQIHGKGLSADNIDNLNTISGNEATATTRLFELWYEQRVSDWLRIRIGEQSAGAEFLLSTVAKSFVNGAFGWPTLAAADLPAGGPNYPLATPGLRFRVDASDALTFFAGVFNGNSAGPGPGDPQQRDPSGTAFRVNDGAFAIYEFRYNPGNLATNATYKFGGWYNSERFADLRLDTNEMSLASPATSGVPRQHTGNFSFYAIIDQPLFGGSVGDHGWAMFGRIMGAPGDRNLVDTYADGGLTYKNGDPNWFGQTGDTVGMAVAYARIGGAARALAADTASFGTQPYPHRTSETVFELTYQIGLIPGWQVQPDLQYVLNPGGGIPNPQSPPGRIRNAVIGGLRTTLNF